MPFSRLLSSHCLMNSFFYRNGSCTFWLAPQWKRAASERSEGLSVFLPIQKSIILWESLCSAAPPASSSTVFSSHTAPAPASSHQPANIIFLLYHSRTSHQLQPSEQSESIEIRKVTLGRRIRQSQRYLLMMTGGCTMPPIINFEHLVLTTIYMSVIPKKNNELSADYSQT